MTVAPAEPETLADVLGDVPLDCILWSPRPGMATEEDFLRIKAQEPRRRLELIDGVIVEKPMGARESYLSFTLMGFFWLYERTHNIGVFGSPDATMRLRAGLIRLPDIHFTNWDNLPEDSAHLRPVADCPPDLAIEILSESDRPGNTTRRVREYFTAGTKQIWVIDPRARIVKLYSNPVNPVEATTYTETDSLSGEPLLPGFSLSLSELFGDPQLNPRT